jgi:hypothetical protein
MGIEESEEESFGDGGSSQRREVSGPVFEDEVEVQLKNTLKMVGRGLQKNKKDQQLMKVVTR